MPNSASRELFTSDNEEPMLKKHKGNSDLCEYARLFEIFSCSCITALSYT